MLWLLSLHLWCTANLEPAPRFRRMSMTKTRQKARESPLHLISKRIRQLPPLPRIAAGVVTGRKGILQVPFTAACFCSRCP